MANISVRGKVWSDIELKNIGSRNIAVFKVSESRKNKKTDQWESTVFRVTCWEGAESLQEMFSKGAKVQVSGRFWPSTFKGQDGVEKQSLDVNCNAQDIEVLEQGQSELGLNDSIPF
jgi:single-stranded DNA-binding protein